MECLRVCPSDNIAVNLRPWGSDLGPKTKHRLDEAFLGLVMLASALVDSAVFLGPVGAVEIGCLQHRQPGLVPVCRGLSGRRRLGVLPGLLCCCDVGCEPAWFGARFLATIPGPLQPGARPAWADGLDCFYHLVCLRQIWLRTPGGFRSSGLGLEFDRSFQDSRGGRSHVLQPDCCR